MLTISCFENRYIEWYSRSDEMSLFDKLIKECANFIQHLFLSDILSDVIGVTTK